MIKKSNNKKSKRLVKTKGLMKYNLKKELNNNKEELKYRNQNMQLYSAKDLKTKKKSLVIFSHLLNGNTKPHNILKTMMFVEQIYRLL